MNTRFKNCDFKLKTSHGPYLFFPKKFTVQSPVLFTQILETDDKMKANINIQKQIYLKTLLLYLHFIVIILIITLR